MSLLKRFQHGSELDSVGHFTLDEKRAKNKMARFQLVRQEDFLLLVSQAVMAANAQRLDFVLSGSNVAATCPDVELDADLVRTLENYLFDTRPESISYYLLGVARNAVTPFCSEEPTVEMVDGALHFQCQLKEPMVDLKEHLETFLRHSEKEVSINGKAIARLPLEGQDLVHLSDSEVSALTLVRYGVVVGAKTFESPLEFRAVASQSTLTLDASFSNVVENEEYEKVKNRVQQRVLELVVERVGEHSHYDETAEALLRDWLLLDLADPAGQALRACPLFPLADRQKVLSLEELHREVSGGRPLLFSSSRLNLQLDTAVVLTQDSQVLRTLRGLFSDRLQDATAAYRRRVERERHKEQWERSPRPTELPPGRYLAQDTLEGPDWQAAVGYLGAPGGESHVDMLFQGKLLCSERLDGLPPGATAVINFDSVDINELWTHPEGRNFRSTMTAVRAKLEKLFDSIVLTRETLYPGLTEYLEGLFDKLSPLPDIALHAPLFTTFKGPPMSLQELRECSEVGLGNPVLLSERIPKHLLPDVIVPYSPRTKKMLGFRLSERCKDVRDFQQRLSAIDRQLQSPLPARLENLNYAAREIIDKDDLQGEIAIHGDMPGPKVAVVLLHQGARIDELELNLTKVLHGTAVVQLERLKPNPDWSGIEKDQTYRNLVAWLRERFRNLEAKAIDSGVLSGDYALKLMQAYGLKLEDYSDLKIFESTTPSRNHSFQEVRKEIEEHGNILRAPMGVVLSDRLVLLETSRERGTRESLLLEALGDFKWGDAQAIAEQRELQAGFQARLVQTRIEVRERGAFTAELESCRGEVKVGISLPFSYLDCYYTGRFVCRKTGVLPLGCAGVIDSDKLILREDFNDAEIPPEILKELLELSEHGLLACAEERGNEAVQELAFDYATHPGATECFQEELRKLQIFERQGGTWMSLKELEDEEKSPAYVSKSFPKQIEPDRLVLRLNKQESALIRSRTQHRPYKFENQLFQLQKDRDYLADLDTEIPGRFTFRKTVEDRGLNIRMGLVPAESRILGFDEEGKPLGFMRLRSLPVWALVQPARPGKRDKLERPTSTLKSTDRGWVQDRVDELYLEWAESLCHKELSHSEVQDAIRILNLTKHELGSQSDHPQAAIAQKLWSIPFFRCVDDSRVSGEALGERLLEEGVIQVTRERWRVPGDLPQLEEGSDEFALLKSVFGEKSLHWFEAPPIVDTDQIRSNISKLVAWGVSPFHNAKKRFDDFARKIEERRAAESEAEPEPKPEPNKAPRPEKLFLQKMKSEAKAILGHKLYKRSNLYFAKTEIGNWLLGPPIYLTNDIYHFNSAHSGVRWLIHTEEKSGDMSFKVGRTLLLIHWVGLVNVSSEELTDVQEQEFLLELSERLVQTFV